MAIVITACSDDENPPFNDCQVVDNPQEVIIGKWKFDYSLTEDGKYSMKDTVSLTGNIMEYYSNEQCICKNFYLNKIDLNNSYKIFVDSLVIYF